MKKILTALIVALVVMTSAFAFSFKSAGIEAGKTGTFVVADFEIIDNLDAYVRTGYAYSRFNVSAGAQYKVWEFDLGSTPIAVKPGAQVDFYFFNGFLFSGFVTCQFSYNAGSIEGFVRPGVGINAAKNYVAPSWVVEAGAAYLF